MKRILIPILLGLCLPLSATSAAEGGAQPATVLGAHDRPIHDAARLGSGQDVEKILKAEPAMRDVRTQHGSTPLHLAATNPDTGALKALLAAGADVNARDSEGLTPLHMTAYTQNAKHAQLLLEAGADPYAKTNAGRDPTSMARKTRSDEVAGVISLWILKGCKAGKPC
ncbi:ankyrin repeat domain-containing protein [Azospira restricta]|uniref:Ankyrin repeat domain-containing protein n=1 Tax=Azospira restricta TaxID=404405 RepID=A0A974SMK7_9RHOO|nr:ankyrin repeat domain-containing protein [Azospira restricta]QRJ62319.1 ankyrin repeat domain-containing protein [Azospira restricta]